MYSDAWKTHSRLLGVNFTNSMMRLILIVTFSLTFSGCMLVPVIVPMKERCTMMRFKAVEGMTVEQYFNRVYTPSHTSRYCAKKTPESFTFKFSDQIMLNMRVGRGRLIVSSESEKTAMSVKSKNAPVIKSSKAKQIPAWRIFSTYGVKEGYLNVQAGEGHEVNLYYELTDCSCPTSIWE